MRSQRRSVRGCAALLAVLLGPPAAAAAQEVPSTPPGGAAGSSRMFMGPTARMVEPGGGYFVGYGIIGLPTVQVGVTPRFSLGAGTCLCGPVVLVAPKFRVSRGDRTDVAVGVAHLQTFGYGGSGMAYGVATSGTPDASVTVGLGTLYHAGDEGAAAVPLLLLGGERRAGARVLVITENYIGPGGGLLSAGVRFHGRQFAFDLGLIAPIVEGGIAFVGPLMNVAWKFGG